MNSTKRYVIPGIISLVAIAILYYVEIPAINFKNVDFWWFLVFCIIIVAVCFGVPKGVDTGTSFFDNLGEELRTKGIGALFDFGKKKAGEAAEADTKKKKKVAHHPIFIMGAVAVFIVLFVFLGSVFSSPFFNARAYSSLLQVEDGDFAQDISEISMKSVPVVDKDTAVRLGSRTIGEISDLVSQYTVDEDYNAYTQINYKSQPYRVSSLVYADIIKWITNTMSGLPGYVTVNMATQETKLVRLPEDEYMHYSTGEHFNNYLYRYVRFQYPTEMFGVAAFEIDEQGTPYWIVPTVDMRIGIFGGEDYDGAILVNACTGETAKYNLDEIPQWCDKVFAADLVYSQLDCYGRYQKGFWNSIIGQSGVQVPTGSTGVSNILSASTDSVGNASGYNYLAIDDDVFMYTGMTSANSDQSLVGFVLVNLRTKETHYYECAGATESSAMSSAEGQVQQMSYVATIPLLLNVADRPTYFLSLKDQAGLVKMYAFIDVQRYQLVGTGSTVAAAKENYIAALSSDDEVDVDASAMTDTDVDLPVAEGTIDGIQAVVVDGNTQYYFKLKGDNSIYVASISVSETLPFLSSGDKVEITYAEEGNVRTVSSLK